MKIITKDLYEAAYLLTHGHPLQELFGDTRTVLFQFEGDEESLRLLKHKYDQGQAQANVLQLKKNMSYLKDVLFSKIRESKNSSRL